MKITYNQRLLVALLNIDKYNQRLPVALLNIDKYNYIVNNTKEYKLIQRKDKSII